MRSEWLAKARVFAQTAIALTALAAGCTVGGPGTIEEGDGTLSEESTEAEISRACSGAADRLEACTGDVPPEFSEACEHDPDEESLRAIEEIAGAECGDLDPNAKADGLFEGAFARVCSPAVATAYLINRQRNPSSQPLTADQKRALRPVFGGFVDRANVHWDAALIDSWDVAGVEFELSNIAAMAFGNDIFVAGSYRPGDISQLALLAHELTHTWQAARLGGIREFADEYCRGYYRAGFDYDDNDFEIEARQVQDQVEDCLRDGTC